MGMQPLVELEPGALWLGVESDLAGVRPRLCTPDGRPFIKADGRQYLVLTDQLQAFDRVRFPRWHHEVLRWVERHAAEDQIDRHLRAAVWLAERILRLACESPVGWREASRA